jgi:membrane-associated phospholipid phosphatase
MRMSDVDRGNSADGDSVMAWTPEAQRFGFATGIATRFAEARLACGVFEWIALGYLGLSSVLIVLFAETLIHPARLVATQALVAAIILLLCHAGTGSAELAGPTAEFSSRFWHFWRHWYPHLFFLFCFEELRWLVHLVNPGWQDAKLLAFDRWLTGVNPSLWFEHLARPALTEFMEFSYFSYFAYLLILGGVLYYRRDWENYWAVMTYSAVGYAFGYVTAMLFPVESPWFMLAGQWHRELTGGPFTGLIQLIEKYGRVHGAAFPSQHVAGAMAALWGAWRHRRWLFWTFLPFVACMCISTVYVRNHYVADVLGGLLTGTLGYFLGRWAIEASGRVTNTTGTRPGKRADFNS